MTLRDFAVILTRAQTCAIRRAMSEFFHMGGYAAYVWPAYGVSALVIAWLAFTIWRRRRALKRRLSELETSEKSKET